MLGINGFGLYISEHKQHYSGRAALIPQKNHLITQVIFLESGGDLLSRAVTSQVPSALKSLTSVFGMGTGGTPSSLPPEMVSVFIQEACPQPQSSQLRTAELARFS